VTNDQRKPQFGSPFGLNRSGHLGRPKKWVIPTVQIFLNLSS